MNLSANVAATQNVDIRAHACIQTLIQGFADQGVADGDFQHTRHSGEKIAQVGLRQIVPGIDAQACGTGTLRGVGEQRQGGIGLAAGMRVGIRAGVQLDTVRTERGRAGDVRVTCIDEQADTAAQPLERCDQLGELDGVLRKIETVIGRQLSIAIRYQGDLLGARGTT